MSSSSSSGLYVSAKTDFRRETFRTGGASSGTRTKEGMRRRREKRSPAEPRLSNISNQSPLLVRTHSHSHSLPAGKEGSRGGPWVGLEGEACLLGGGWRRRSRAEGGWDEEGDLRRLTTTTPPSQHLPHPQLESIHPHPSASNPPSSDSPPHPHSRQERGEKSLKESLRPKLTQNSFSSPPKLPTLLQKGMERLVPVE